MTELAVGEIPSWTLGDRLRKAREHAGLEQGELAARIGISRGTVSNYELNHGTRPRKLVVLRAWADTCRVPLVWLEHGEIPRSGGPNEGCEVRHQGLEPRTRWFGRSGERRGFMPVVHPGGNPYPRRRTVTPVAADTDPRYAAQQQAA